MWRSFQLEFMYHIWILSHFRRKPFNHPFYLKISLVKVAIDAKKQTTNTEKNVHDHVFLYIIICEVLFWQQDDCDGFLKRNNFVEVDEFVHKISMGGAMIREQKGHEETGSVT